MRKVKTAMRVFHRVSLLPKKINPFISYKYKEDITMTQEEMVLITKVEYERLKRDSEVLNWLQCNGVDNWSNYSLPPDREDYDTDGEYQAAYDKALRERGLRPSIGIKIVNGPWCNG